MFAGGSEAVITPLAVGGFAAMRALSTRNDEPERASRPWDLNRDGFVMGEGAADWSRLESLFGLVRVLGGGETLAWSVQAAAALALAGAIGWLWRTSAEFEIKAAALSCAALLATPYIYMYDQVMLAVPVAFLLRLALARGFFVSEIAGLAAGALLLLLTPWGIGATAIVGLLIVQRHITDH